MARYSAGFREHDVLGNIIQEQMEPVLASVKHAAGFSVFKKCGKI